MLPPRVEITVEGEIGAYDTRIVGLSVLKGLFGGVSDEPVTYVNAPQRAKEAGIDVREVSSTSSADYVNLITHLRRRPLAVGHAGRAAQRAPHRARSTGTRSTCRRPITC